MTKRLSTKRNIEIDSDILEWYRFNFPGRSLSWIINLTLRELKDLYEKSKTPKRAAMITAAKVTEKI